ncbi:MAG: recombinase family protein [Methylocella sp.]|nr:MAG: hypothetical protein DLM68_02210 [Hyphomicrobiales bacterium]
MATYGYARVSSSDQSTETQVQKLKAAGCQVVRTEKLSGKSREGRDQLATVLEFIGPGDVLVCVKLDRLGRSTRDVLNVDPQFANQAGADFKPAVGSRLQNAGANLYSVGVVWDFNKNPRPSSGAFTMGAFQPTFPR